MKEVIWIEFTCSKRFLKMILELRDLGIPCRGTSDDMDMYQIEIQIK